MDQGTITEPVVRLTERSAEELRGMLGKPENAGESFRLYVEEGGCSGMQYAMTFDQQLDNGAQATIHGVPVVVDPFSAEYLAGSVVDFNDNLTAGGFRISNPKARQSCGCGKSFTA